MFDTSPMFYSSLTRISDLRSGHFELKNLPRNEWQTGDYVIGEVAGLPCPDNLVELDSGRLIEALPGDHVIGAFGKRAATLGGVGNWEAIENDGLMDALTCAGLFGKATSISHTMPGFMKLSYKGHVVREKGKLRMNDFVGKYPETKLQIPVILLVGTSMSAGKTTTGRVIVHLLKCAGLNVVGAKFTGAGRFRDTLSFGDAGADHIFDFVDAGLPSTVVPESEFIQANRNLISRIAGLNADILVAEAGASPLEPYNGALAISELKENICFTVLCASDPYAVVGVQTAFNLHPDLVTGPATNTTAAISLVNKLTNIKALNIADHRSHEALFDLLKERLPINLL